MIRRLWHGWTTGNQADTYERLLREEIFPGIVERRIPGLFGLEAWRRPAGDEVEFVTLMSFGSWDSVAEFTGGDPQISVVPDAARQLLKRFDEHSQHYDTVISAL